ncbi:MAG: hypothetical protein D6791_03625 [Chloroflexi bacterium]|nr:MAG: hypothetical protein D6791_03625 [Chloroflexota bacterium]
MTPTSPDIRFDHAIDVTSIAQEYEIIGRQRCDCGGRLQLTRQSLVTHGHHHYDLMETECMACHRPRNFLFNIDSFFGKDRV